MKIHHISSLTGDFDQNFHFYVDILGLRMVKNSINQGNIYMRHVYYGDFLGSPGTVITFFPDARFNQERLEARNALSGIKLKIPKGSLDFWVNRLKSFGLFPTIIYGKIFVRDYDDLLLEMVEVPEQLTDWQVNALTDVPAEFQITGLLGTNIIVPDVEKSKQFFEDMVGDWSAVKLEESQSQEDSRWGRGSVDHIAFAVQSKANLDDIWQKAKTLGYMRESYVDRGYFSSVYLIEPGGNRIEFATLTPGFTLDESVQDLGTTFALPPRYEERRAELTKYFEKEGVNFNQVVPAVFSGDVTVKEGEVQRDRLHF